jgi:hypothetical protein
MYSIKQTFCDVHHVWKHVPDDVEHAQHQEEAEAVDACSCPRANLLRTLLHGVDFAPLSFHFFRSSQVMWWASFGRAPAIVGAIRVSWAQVSAIKYAYIVPRRVWVEETMAPVASIGPGVLHGCTFSQSWIIADPEQEDDLQPEHTVGVGDILGVVHNPEPVGLPPQHFIHEDRHERAHTLWVPN